MNKKMKKHCPFIRSQRYIFIKLQNPPFHCLINIHSTLCSLWTRKWKWQILIRLQPHAFGNKNVGAVLFTSRVALKIGEYFFTLLMFSSISICLVTKFLEQDWLCSRLISSGMLLTAATIKKTHISLLFFQREGVTGRSWETTSILIAVEFV